VSPARNWCCRVTRVKDDVWHESVLQMRSGWLTRAVIGAGAVSGDIALADGMADVLVEDGKIIFDGRCG